MPCDVERVLPRDARSDALSELGELLARRKPDHGLEGAFHLSDALFELEMQAIFARHWIHVGAAADVPRAGDHVTLEFGRFALVLVRGHDGVIRGFHNVCRHRGARLVPGPRGSTKKFVCRYHQWTYDVSGPLVHAEHLPASVDRSCLGLKPVHLRNLSGLLFVSLAQEPPADLDALASALTTYLGPHQLDRCKIAHQSDSILDGNWKLVMENNRECHHCARHPELLKSYFQFFAHSEHDVKPRQRDYYERYLRTRAEMDAIWQGCQLPHQLIEALDADRQTPFRLERLALDAAGESYTLDTRVACKRLLGSFTQPRLGALSLHTQPNSWNHFLSDHAVVFSVFPLSAQRTLLRTKWLVHADAVDGVDYELPRLTEVWLKTNEQDAHFVSMQASGVSNPAYEPGPFCPNENQLEKFYSWYLERMRAAL